MRNMRGTHVRKLISWKRIRFSIDVSYQCSVSLLDRANIRYALVFYRYYNKESCCMFESDNISYTHTCYYYCTVAIKCLEDERNIGIVAVNE